MIFRTAKSYEAEILWLRAQLERAHERIDRLTEGLARKNGGELIMPQAPLPRFDPGPYREKEKSSGWWDTVKPTPPASPKTSGGKSK